MKKELIEGETIIYTAKFHWMMYWPAIIFPIGLFSFERLKTPLPILIFIILIFLLSCWIIRKGNGSFLITNKRLIRKRGLLNKHYKEIVLGKCESVYVKQTILGRILNYGGIIIMSAGSEIGFAKYVVNPMTFNKIANEQMEI